MLQSGSTTATTIATIPSATASRFGIPSSRGEEAGRPALQEEDDAHQDRDLAEHRAERGLDPLGEATETGRRQERPPELAHTTGAAHRARIHGGCLRARR